MLCNSYIAYNSYIVEWEITINNYINVTWCLLGSLIASRATNDIINSTLGYLDY